MNGIISRKNPNKVKYNISNLINSSSSSLKSPKNKINGDVKIKFCIFKYNFL